MEPCYTAASRWVPDQALLNLASECLPPPLEFALTGDAVKAGNWKQAVQDLTATAGYTAFFPDASVPAKAYNDTEQRFAARLPSTTCVLAEPHAPRRCDAHLSHTWFAGPVAAAGKGAHNSFGATHGDGSDSSSSSSSDDDDVPSWKREQLKQQKAEAKQRELEAKQRRKVCGW